MKLRPRGLGSTVRPWRRRRLRLSAAGNRSARLYRFTTLWYLGRHNPTTAPLSPRRLSVHIWNNYHQRLALRITQLFGASRNWLGSRPALETSGRPNPPLALVPAARRRR